MFRVKRLRGELFGLLTLAVTFVLATIVLNTRIDGGPGVYLSAVPLPRLVASPTGTLFLLALVLAVAHGVGSRTGSRARGSGWGSTRSTTTRTSPRSRACPRSPTRWRRSRSPPAVAGIAGGIHAIYVSYVTVAETFSITVPLYVVLMSVLGGARHWLGPAVGATIIASSLYAFTGGGQAILGRAAVALVLVLLVSAAARGPRAGGARALALRAARRGSGDLRRRGGRGLGDGLARRGT